MFRTTLACALSLVALATGIATTGASAATDESITIGPSTVLVNPNGYRFAIDVSCADATPCKGLLSIQTVAIKPYTWIAKKKWNVGALPFTVPAGTTAPVRHRLLAGALVHAKLTGKVRVLVQIVRDGQVVGSRYLTLKLNHNW